MTLPRFDMNRRTPRPPALGAAGRAEPPRQPPAVLSSDPEFRIGLEAPVRQAPPPAPPQPPLRVEASPPPPPPPTRQEAINSLLQALAARELAVAHLLNAEAEKVAQVAVDAFRPESFDDLLSFQRTVAEIMQAVVRKEEVLLRKLTALAALCAEERQTATHSVTYDGPPEVAWAPKFAGHDATVGPE